MKYVWIKMTLDLYYWFLIVYSQHWEHPGYTGGWQWWRIYQPSSCLNMIVLQNNIDDCAGCNHCTLVDAQIYKYIQQYAQTKPATLLRYSQICLLGNCFLLNIFGFSKRLGDILEYLPIARVRTMLGMNQIQYEYYLLCRILHHS